jgi:hypothetical protein
VIGLGEKLQLASFGKPVQAFAANPTGAVDDSNPMSKISGYWDPCVTVIEGRTAEMEKSAPLIVITTELENDCGG